MSDNDAELEVFQGEINTGNPEPRCACMLVLDTSSSMSGKPIKELNDGIARFAEELQEDPLARKRTEVAVVTFGSTVQVRSPFVEVGAFEPVELQAAGTTPMGAGILLALDELEQRKRIYREMGFEFFRPWLILMTDGAPTDSDAVEKALSRLLSWEDKKHVSVFPIGIGDGADMAFLARTSAQRDPLHLKDAQLTDFFVWASVNLGSVASSVGHGASDDEVNRKLATGEQVALTAPPRGYDYA